MMKGNLLIVDDEPAIVEILESNFQDIADHVFTASSGAEGFEIFIKETIHCIVSDIRMPKMDGMEFLKKIRSINAHVPFIFFTSERDHRLMLEANQYDAFDYVNKPNQEDLEGVVKDGLFCGINQKEYPRSASRKGHVSDYIKYLSRLKINSSP